MINVRSSVQGLLRPRTGDRVKKLGASSLKEEGERAGEMLTEHAMTEE